MHGEQQSVVAKFGMIQRRGLHSCDGHMVDNARTPILISAVHRSWRSDRVRARGNEK
jgi:hypothetical protein